MSSAHNDPPINSLYPYVWLQLYALSTTHSTYSLIGAACNRFHSIELKKEEKTKYRRNGTQLHRQIQRAERLE